MEKEGVMTEVIVQEELQAQVTLMREELDDHLTSINDNSSEIGANFAAIDEINDKVDKLAERLDKITLFLQKFDANFETKKTFQIQPLSRKEERVFQALYALLHEHTTVTYKILAAELGFTEILVKNYIVNLVEKGVPVKKVIVNKSAHLILDNQFKQQQAKKNLIGHNIPLTYWGFA